MSANAREHKQEEKDIVMRSFTDVFIKHPVLAVVVNLVILLAGWRALTLCRCSSTRRSKVRRW